MIAQRRDWILLVFTVAAILGAVGLQAARDRRYPRDGQETERMLYVRSGSALKRLTPGFNALAADVYWIRALQHYGGDRLSPQPGSMKYQLLNPLLDIATTLDPYFNIAYRFGAIFLSEGYPGGPGRPDQGVALLRKALVVMPHKWQYYYDIGFVYYWHLRDFHGAAEWFQRAALQPNAPNWLAPLAASMLVQGQDRASARFMWQQIQRSEEAWLRRGAERALLQLQALDEIDELEAVIRRFPPPSGDPHTWVALVRRGVLLRVPLDPAGAPFDLDPGTGRVTLSSQSPLYPPPDVTRRLQ